MLEIQTNDKMETVIRDDFWEFDRLYFALVKFTGNFGPEHSETFKGYDDVCESLLGLNYEIRHAQQGDRELYTQNSGIHEDWFGTKRINVTDEFRQLEDNMEFNGIDLEKFYDLDRDEKEATLIDYGYEPDEYENYLDAFDDDYYRFRKEDHLHVSKYNTLFQFRISIYEAVFYALIIREMLPKKDEYLAHLRKAAENPVTSLEPEYYHVRVWQDLDLIDLYKVNVFWSIYRILGDKKYVYYIDQFSQHPDGFKDADLLSCNKLIMQYQERESPKDQCAELSSFLDQLLSYLG